MTALHELARQAGVQRDWRDASGTMQRTSDMALRRVLGALGLPAETAQAIAHSLAQCREARRLCAFVSADQGQAITLPAGCGQPGRAELALEDGTTCALEVERRGDALRIAGGLPTGYHRLHLGQRTISLAIAPARCLSVGDLAPGRRIWGPAVQIPSLRDHAARAFGDFGSLASSVRAFAGAGADLVAISPAHALFPADASRFGPYAPSSRLFMNTLFGDPALIGHPLPLAASSDLIDWQHAAPARLAGLRSAFRARGDAVKSAVAAYRAAAGEDLEHHAIFDALHTHFFDVAGARGWHDWPSAFHDPESPAVARFAARHRDEIEFFIFAQWLARESLRAAQNAARAAGMAIGLIADLAVGMDAGGSHAWSHRDEVLSGLSIGAPPDLLGPDGQDWGITGFAPAALRRTGFRGFIATLRAGLDHVGGIRIDHALGLNRLWIVPHGCASAQGAYLTFPRDDLLRILAIESHRAHALIIGEDLGTIPEGLQPLLEARQVLSMRVLWFERDAASARFIPPQSWPAQAAAMTSTHDLPTVAGWWRGRDIDWNRKLNRGSTTEAASRATRAADRRQLWTALRASGAASGAQPAARDSGPVSDAVMAHIGATACDLALVPLEDIAGLVEQPNLPGTIDEHPNWRRRMPCATEELVRRPEVAKRLTALNRSRQ